MEKKISNKDELSEYLKDRSWLHFEQLNSEMTTWLDEEDEYNVLHDTYPGEGGSIIWIRHLHLPSGRYELNYVTFGENICNDIYDTAFQVTKIDEVEACKLALFSQFGELEKPKSEEIPTTN